MNSPIGQLATPNARAPALRLSHAHFVGDCTSAGKEGTEDYRFSVPVSSDGGAEAERDDLMSSRPRESLWHA
jgi:hypothetical protein